MKRVHWLGAGLSSVPGIRRIAHSGRPMILWNRTVAKASAAIAGIQNPQLVAKKFDVASFQTELGPGDVVVSMLPAPMHPEIALLCLRQKSHLVTTSYISDRMRDLDAEAQALGLSFVNEVGLDPGLDHLLAHELVAQYRESQTFSPEHQLSFRSYCGGFPKTPGPFRYKFSWSPIGVLRALKSRACYIRGGETRVIDLPYRDLQSLPIAGEDFEAYPNRDSTPYLQEYGFKPEWKVDEFIRGTLRLQGWAKAWAEIFATLEGMDLTQDEPLLEALSNRLWKEHQYQPTESDRVVLYVALEAKQGGKIVWSHAYLIDEAGSQQGSAMARLVSLPASFAVEALLAGTIPAGVSGAPRDRQTIAQWLRLLAGEAIRVDLRSKN